MLLGKLRPGQRELSREEGGEAHHLDAGEVAEQLIQQWQPQVSRALHQLAHLLQAFEAAGFTEQLQEDPLRTSVTAIKILMAGELETPISIDGPKSLKTKRPMNLEISLQLLTIQYKLGRNFAK